MELHPPDVDHQSGIDYLEELLRAHLDAFNEATIATNGPEYVPDILDGAFTGVICALEHKMAALSALLRAVITIKNSAGPAEQVAAAEKFLVHTYKSCMPEPWALEFFLQECLEYILLRHAGAEEMAMDDEPQAGITVLLGDSWVEVPFAEVLQFFWKDRLDTNCQDCGKPFTGEPPVRTISFLDGAGVRLRVFNRHFACTRRRGTASFVPVSHVWHDSIREANQAWCHIDAAAQKLIETLRGFAVGTRDAYDKETEFWHDYFSVPQWNPAYKEALLLRLPIIYHLADEILVHMAHMPHTHVRMLLVDQLNPFQLATFTLRQALERMVPLRSLGRSQWTHRMWAAIEYAQSREACVMDASNHVWRGGLAGRRSRDGAPATHRSDVPWTPRHAALHRNTFGLLFLSTQQRMVVTSYSPLYAHNLPRSEELFGRVSDRSRSDEPWAEGLRTRLTLGEALDIVSVKQCFVPRDRLLAAYVLVEGWDMTWDTNVDASGDPITAIPHTFDGACDWAWRRALRGNDWSPLLLRPTGRKVGESAAATSAAASLEGDVRSRFVRHVQSMYEPDGEPEPVRTLTELVGRAALGRAKCGLHRQFSAPSRSAPVVDVLDGENGTSLTVVRAELDFVGTIEELRFLDMDSRGNVEGVAWAVSLLGDIAKGRGEQRPSVDALVDGVDRIFPLDTYHRWLAQLGSYPKVVFTELFEANPRLRDYLEELLARFFADCTAEGGEEKLAAERKKVAQEMVELLAMDADMTVRYGCHKITRLGSVARNAPYGQKTGVPVTIVRCPGCDIVTPECLDLWTSNQTLTHDDVVGLRLYRIRGLSYGKSAPDGVGLVLDNDGRIRGRMLFTQPACQCELVRTVVIKVD